jgi:hypothetical protein
MSKSIHIDELHGLADVSAGGMNCAFKVRLGAQLRPAEESFV